MNKKLLVIAAVLVIGGYAVWKTQSPQSGASRPIKKVNVPPIFSTISAGDKHVVAIDASGRLFGWGSNFRGGLAWPEICSQPIPKLISDERQWRSVHTGSKASYAIANDGTLWRRPFSKWSNAGCELVEGDPLPYDQVEAGKSWLKVQEVWGTVVGLDESGGLWVWSEDRYSDKEREYTAVPAEATPITTAANPWSDFCMAGSKLFAIGKDGSLWTDKKSFGAYGVNSVQDFEFLESIPLKAHLTRIFCSPISTTVFLLDDDANLWGFGANGFGELGNGDGKPSTRNASVPQTAIVRTTDMRWRTIAVTRNFTLGIDDAGQLWSWGNGMDGTLGTGELEYTDIPKLVDRDRKWLAVTSYDQFAVGLTSDGAVFTWGRNDGGVLGDGGSAGMHTTPTPIYGDVVWAIP